MLGGFSLKVGKRQMIDNTQNVINLSSFGATAPATLAAASAMASAIDRNGVEATGSGCRPQAFKGQGSAKRPGLPGCSNLDNIYKLETTFSTTSAVTSTTSAAVSTAANRRKGNLNTDRKKRGRLHWALHSGLRLFPNADYRFLTLTSKHRNGKLVYDFKMFVNMIRRATPASLFKKGYLTERQYKAYKFPDRKLRLEYCGLSTDEGNGVIHVLIRGDFLPVKFIRELWVTLHDSPFVNIKKIKVGKDNLDKTVAYVVGQYISKQKKYGRKLQSKGWLFPNARLVWLKTVKECVGKSEGEEREEKFKQALGYWRAYLDDYRFNQAVLP